jgi:hypothetical protein
MRCNRQVRLCPQCDVGQRYCSAGCSTERRRQAQRNASSDYQRTRRGAKLHAVRMQRYRERRAQDGKLSAQIVTQQSWLQPPEKAITDPSTPAVCHDVDRTQEDSAHASPPSTDQSPSPDGSANRPRPVYPLPPASRCSLCHRLLPRLARLDALRPRAHCRRRHFPGQRRVPRAPTGTPKRSR